MSNIEKSTLIAKSILKEENGFHFIDGYRGHFADTKNEIDIQQIGKLFFSSGPKWIDSLFLLRNRIVQLLGLKVPDRIAEREIQLQYFNCEPGEQLGLFKIFQRTDNEVILGEDDKHLDFRVSLYLQKSSHNDKEKELTISTFVKFHNSMGKLYFIPVKPFHSFIVPAMLKGIIRNIKV